MNYIFFRIKLAITRIPCLLYGCKEASYCNGNMPDDYNDPVYCKRCGAVFDVYNIESTSYPLMYGVDTFLTRLSEWLKI